MRTQVAIVGAGPSGLLLSQLLCRRGVESVVVEDRSQAHVLARIRAGVLEQGAVQVLTEAGVGDRLHAEGFRHDGIHLQWPGERRHLDFQGLCGASVWVYGQTEVTKDLVAAREAAGQRIVYEARDVAVHDLTTDRPRVTFTAPDGTAEVIEADYVAGCDGFHGVCREAIPAAERSVYQRVYPFSWLGILARVAPSTDHLIYALHPDGFALHSMRSAAVSRLYVQVAHGDDVANWPDDRVWEALATRFALDGWTLRTGPVAEKSITPMRSFVSAPMRWGRLFLAGDAAHIVPPTGAKGLNLAIADVKRLAVALAAALTEGRTGLLETYSDDALRRVWQATYFSWWMTSMMHAPPAGDPDREFSMQVQLAQVRHVTSSEAAARTLAENYTGTVLPWP